MKLTVVLTILFLSSFIIPSKVIAADYHMSLNGSDSNSGTASSPFKTFTKSMSVLRPGDTLNVSGGTYTERLEVTVSGTAASPITIKSVSGDRAILNGNGSSDTPVLISAGRSNINLSGFAVTNSSYECVLVRGSNINISNFDVYNCPKFGYRLVGTDITVENSICRDSVTENAGGRNSSGGWGSCLRTGPGSGNITIRNNKIYNNWGEGLIIGQAAGLKAYGNEVHDNFSVNIYIGNAFNIDVYKNITYSTDSRYFRSGQAASCISASEELISSDWGARLANVRVFNNFGYGCKMGIGYTYAEVSNNGCNNCLFAYNTMVNTGGLKVINGTKNNILVVNNIFKGGTKVVPGSGVTERNNIWGDPGFSGNPSPSSPNSYSLSANSIAINRGEIVNGINEDYFGRSRGGSPDIGAIEAGGGQVNLSPTPSGNNKPGDINSDNRVDIIDIGIVIDNYGRFPIPNPKADVNRDGSVNIIDIGMVIDNYGK